MGAYRRKREWAESMDTTNFDKVLRDTIDSVGGELPKRNPIPCFEEDARESTSDLTGNELQVAGVSALKRKRSQEAKTHEEALRAGLWEDAEDHPVKPAPFVTVDGRPSSWMSYLTCCVPGYQ